jgi:hypothetical protein
MAWRSSTTDVGAWALVVTGFCALVAGVTLAFGGPVALMAGGVLLLWAGLRAARRTV